MGAFDDSETDDSRNKLYVAITRARYSVAFSYEGGNVIEDAQVWIASLDCGRLSPLLARKKRRLKAYVTLRNMLSIVALRPKLERQPFDY